MDKQIIYSSVVGSHLFGMNRPDSDIGLFQVFVEDPRNILRGTADFATKVKATPEVDTNTYELGHVVNILLTGNINFVLGVTSPKLLRVTSEGLALKNLYIQNLSKNIYKSVRGMSVGMHKKYLEFDRPEPKRSAMILRTIDFAVNLLENETLVFRPSTSSNPDDIPAALDRLKRAYDISSLPESPNEEAFRDFLLSVRLKRLRAANLL